MIKEAIQIVVEGRSLSMDEASQVMEELMDGLVTPSQFGALVTALRIKGETVEEIAGLARTMRAKALKVNSSGPVVDTCGTGGDGASTFNVSTTAAFIAAGAGLKVAKHGNRAMSSKSGSADVLEALGVRIELSPEQVERCLEDVNIGFMFAPAFHPSMKYASAPRREIGIRTVFNILGPLTNPAGAEAQVIGVPSEQFGSRIAEALGLLGTKRAVIVYGLSGLDEITVTDRTRIWELANGRVADYLVSPEEFGYARATLKDIRGGSAAENAQILRSILSGEKGPRRDMAVMNAAAAIKAGKGNGSGSSGVAESLVECAKKAEQAIDSGKALDRLEKLIELTQSFGG